MRRPSNWPPAVMCQACGTPTSPWSCSCGQTRIDDQSAGVSPETPAPQTPAPEPAERPASRPTRDAINRRKQWAYAIVRKAPSDSPAYGTTEWLALPESSPEKVAAVVRAAECWARDGDELEQNLRRELAAARRSHKRREDEEYAARRDTHRAQWGGLRVIQGGAYADTEDFRAGRPASQRPKPGGGAA